MRTEEYQCEEQEGQQCALCLGQSSMKDTTSAGVVDEVKFSPTDGKGDSGENKREGEGRGSEGDRQGAVQDQVPHVGND